MNNTKKTLIILAIICNFASIGYGIYGIVSYFQAEPALRSGVAYLVFDFIDIFAVIAINVLLIICISNGGKLFRARYSYYMSAIILSIIMNTISLGTLFLVCTMFVSDWEWVKTEIDDKVVVDDKTEVITKTKEQKIAQLREKRANGQISEEEFQRELLKLL